MNKFLYAIAFCAVAFGAALAVELTGSTSVNVTSDTAASAKNKAFNSARRDVVTRALRRYVVDSAQLEEAIQNSSNEELMDIISSSSVASEKISDTTYSANISFVIDSDAARSWMEKYSVQNSLPTANLVVVPEDSVVVTAILLQPIADWISLNAVARDAKIDLATTNIIGNNISFAVADKDMSKFSSVLRTSGWHIQQTVQGFKIWK